MSSCLSATPPAVESFEDELIHLPLGDFFKPPRDPAERRTTRAEDWSPPDTRICVTRFHTLEFRPTGPVSVPHQATTFKMPFQPANDLAVSMNQVELDNIDAGATDGKWFALARIHDNGFCVLRMIRRGAWQPLSEYDFPPGTLDADYCNMAAMQEAKRFNQRTLEFGIDGAFHWAFAVRPLRRPVAVKGGAL
jgi:hypothetical protein